MSPAVRRTGSRPLLLASVALPWTWFAVRDTAVVLEWVAILLPLLAAGAVVLLVTAGAALRRLWLLVLAGSTAATAVFATVAPWAPQQTPAPPSGLRVVAANVLGDNAREDAVGDDLLATRADVLVVSEVSGALSALSERLDRAYPHRYRAAGGDDVGVWSVHPLDGADLSGDGVLSGARGGRVVVRAPFGPFALYAVHLYRPSRDAFRTEVTISGQEQLVAALDAEVRRDDLPAVLAGDLNVSDRQRGYRTLTHGRVDAARTGWTGPTSLRPRNRPLLLRIDHVLLPGDWCAVDAGRQVLRGSDHRSVSTTVGPCRSEAGTPTSDDDPRGGSA